MKALSTLSERQTQCLYYCVKGFTAKETAKELNLSYRTVEYYIKLMKNKLNCESRSDLIRIALKIPFIKFMIQND